MTRIRRKTGATLTAALMALAVLTGCGTSASTVDLAGTVVDPPYDVSEVALTTDTGQPWAMNKDTTKTLTLVFFGYTQCPDICPGVLSAIASALTRLTLAQQDQVELVFVTTDPEHDTPAVLKDYLGRFNPTYRGLTGTLKDIVEVAKPLHIYVDSGAELPGGGYDPNSHGTQVFGINDRHEAPIFWGAETSPAQFAADFRFLIEEKPDRLRGPNSQD